MTLKVIAYARNGHTDKFGIPRQSREESPILTRIIFEPEFRVAEALRGIEGYSHLWLIWGFSKVDSWSPTVRPPRLGGNLRMGVFATRSPYRPNPIGLSSVRLIAVRLNGKWIMGNGKLDETPTEKSSLELIVSGADVLDGTPIYDIKPYLSFSDCHEDAKNGFAEETRDYKLKVDWTDVGLTLDECRANNMLTTRLSRANNALLERKTHDETEEIKGKRKDYKIEDIEGVEEDIDGVREEIEGVKEDIEGVREEIEGVKEDMEGVREEIDGVREDMEGVREEIEGVKEDMEGVREEIEGVREEIEYILSQDPRPGYQDDPEREYKLDYKGWNVAFTVVNGTVFVKKVVGH